MQKRSLVPMTTVTATLCLLLCYSLHTVAGSPKHRVAFMQTPADITIRGQVTDRETGTPLPGAQVRLKGTGKGAASDADGRYTLSIPDATGTLIVSFMGYTTQEIG